MCALWGRWCGQLTPRAPGPWGLCPAPQDSPNRQPTLGTPGAPWSLIVHLNTALFLFSWGGLAGSPLRGRTPGPAHVGSRHVAAATWVLSSAEPCSPWGARPTGDRRADPARDLLSPAWRFSLTPHSSSFSSPLGVLPIPQGGGDGGNWSQEGAPPRGPAQRPLGVHGVGASWGPRPSSECGRRGPHAASALRRGLRFLCPIPCPQPHSWGRSPAPDRPVAADVSQT